MAIFPHLEIETKIQVGEKTRINCAKSYKTQGEAAITLVRIRPDASLPDWIIVAQTALPVVGDVNDNDSFYVDYEYSTAATYGVEVEITTDGAPVVKAGSIEVVDAASENLFSTDVDLMAIEPDILKFVKDGKSSFNDLHRSCQYKIMDEIYRARIFDVNGDKLVAADVLDIDELKSWSSNLALSLIFQSVSNKVDDIFQKKSDIYAKKAFESKNEAMNQMRLDYNKDAILDANDGVNDLRSIEMVRR